MYASSSEVRFGTVLWYNRTEQYGFIEVDGKEPAQAFFHQDKKCVVIIEDGERALASPHLVQCLDVLDGETPRPSVPMWPTKGDRVVFSAVHKPRGLTVEAWAFAMEWDALKHEVRERRQLLTA